MSEMLKALGSEGIRWMSNLCLTKSFQKERYLKIEEKLDDTDI